MDITAWVPRQRGIWSPRDSPEFSEHSPVGITKGNSILSRVRAAGQAVSVLDKVIRNHANMSRLECSPIALVSLVDMALSAGDMSIGPQDIALGKVRVVGRAGLRQRPRLTVEGRWIEEESEDQCGNCRDQ